MLMQKRVEGKVERVWVGVDLKDLEGVKQLKQPFTSPVNSSWIGKEGKESENFKEYREVASPASVASVNPTPSIGELLGEFRAAYPDCFNNVEFYVWFTRKGLPEKDIEALFKQLVERGEVFSTYEGVWRWA